MGNAHERGERFAEVGYPGYMAERRSSAARPGDEVPASPRTSRRRLVDSLTRQLREMILQHTIPPGTTLLQTEWAEKLNVSRTPLREAFRILEQDGLVRTSNGNRTIEVVRFSGSEMQDLYEVRAAIDGLAARLLATRGVPAGTDQELADLLGVMDQAAEPFESAKWFSAYTAFHLCIAESCGNMRLRQQLDLITMTSLALQTYLVDPIAPEHERSEMLEVVGRQHHAIHAALRAGSGELAEMAARQHIGTILRAGVIAHITEDTDKRAG